MRSPELPRPIITPPDRPFWAYLREHEFRLQRCTDCGAFRFPASPVCAQCASQAHEWAPCSGRGEVFSWVVFHKAYFPALARRVPYNVAMIRLDEGVMFIANIVDVPHVELRRGMPVEVVFDDNEFEDLTVAKFRRHN